MVSRESLARIAAKAVRLIPGISSYQDKEKLRDLDKRLRSHLAATIDEERIRIDNVKALLSKNLKLDLLDDLDSLTRKMCQLADTVKFSAYGYSPLFEQGGVDEQRLQQVYQFDHALEGELVKLKEQVEKVVSSAEAELSASINSVVLALERLEHNLKDREELLRALK